MQGRDSADALGNSARNGLREGLGSPDLARVSRAATRGAAFEMRMAHRVLERRRVIVRSGVGLVRLRCCTRGFRVAKQSAPDRITSKLGEADGGLPSKYTLRLSGKQWAVPLFG